ncbi:MAG: DUF92 domain-containing protein [Gemmatimonadaceae bacterium]|nr:DUF92 domain-containing protein [Gemmatimonadaceae bacterium]
MLLDLIPRMLIGGTLAGVAAGYASRRGQLTLGGEYTAFAVGTAAAVGGIGWLVALAAFFYGSVSLTRWRAGVKRRRSRSTLPDARARDAWQVLANGGLFAVSSLVWAFTGRVEVGLFGFGALAAATADTWATEVGMAMHAAPRSIVGFSRVPPGTSGGVTLFGSAAALAGALLLALCAMASLTTPFDVSGMQAVFLGGAAGAFADSLLGASLQSRRWCDTCAAWTERRVHTCGYRSHHRHGISWMSNDVVNLLATGVGGATAVAAWHA